MTGENKEILREIWEGKLPIRFLLADDEVSALEQPESLYLLVPRMSYLPLVTDKVYKHFIRAVNQDCIEEMWFEFEGQPLKWQYPIGALFDLYWGNNVLPWNLIVHFQKFPADEILKGGKEAAEFHFISCIKEADSLKHKCHVIHGLQKKDHKQLWLGLLNDKFDQFWGVNRRLMERVNDESFRYVPFRLHQVDKPFLQELVPTIKEDGSCGNFGDLLEIALPEAIDEEGKIKKGYRIITQGIEIPQNTDLQWMSYHLSYPDNFLHVAVLTDT
ncbi:Autophagy protein 5 [Trichoplax sp. H2]|uniref:Autophagy protein 5 n=1 Tax=Trichoplax adhaerens TaxID=10228 RepID=B3RNI0_TRIAD|nr:hypothetical protein TRIADDRAFT_53173 [Trichoplax adhaerens]EDV27458.1 hypothetical protein TRIADDRAFT_53173 [Trichoplax adhaerens]RDD44395.1 Autophagy protein 5 [Trichoplax sp. H2]|eukprot:XP_002109292.1 hypothetical protein TRIADDRAFT_53173 [Trichoplax adhaerens]